MSIKVNDNIRALGPKPLDSKYFNATNIPYANSAEVLAAININERHEGLKVRIGSADYEFGADKITLTVTGGGGGGGGTWGLITGDLVDQTDLNTALDNKVNKVTGERLVTAAEITKLGNTSGANTGDQDLSPYELLSSKQSDLTASATKYPTVNAVVTGLALKVDKVAGKSLIADTEVTRLLAITGTNTGDQDLSGKVDVVVGKGLSANDFTDVLKSKLDAITETFTTALKTSYDSAVTWITTNGAGLIAHLTRTDNPHSVTKTQVGLSNVDNTSDAGKPVSTAQQTALDLKQATLTNPITGTGTTNKIPKFTGSSALGNSLVTDDGTTVTVDGLLATSKSVAAGYATTNFTNLASNGYVQHQFVVAANVANLQYAPTLFYKLVTNEANTPIILAPNNTTALTVLPSGASTFASTLQATRLGLGAAANLASYLNVIANTTTVGQLYLPPSAVDYTGTLSGMLWNNTSEWKFYDGVLSSVNRLLKLNGNTALANANALNVVTSTGTGGNLGTLKAEVSFSRFATAVSYAVLLTDVGFGWIIAVTSTAAARTITLPLANTVTAGFQLTVKDESGAAGTNNISIALSGADTTDVTNITTNGGFKRVYSDGVSKWFTI